MGIELHDLKDKSAIEKLKKYEGSNPYIKKLKKDYERDGKINLTDNQAKYIKTNFDVEPIYINKIVEITDYLGESLQNDNDIDFKPERIYIEYILGETDKVFHIQGKLKRNQESKLYWIPKTQVLDDPYFVEKEVEVDFEKYQNLDSENRYPYEHQISGIKFLLSRNRCILADDMGLGKTLEAIIAALESGAERILIVCPSSLKLTWEREINCFDDNTHIVNSKIWDSDKFTIVSYSMLKNFHTIKSKEGEEVSREIVNEDFDLIIVDEAHMVKNHKSNRGKILKDICTNHLSDDKGVWLLTGTPIANRPMDYFNLLSIIKSRVAEDWKFFAQRYCEGKQINKKLKNGKKKKIWLTDGASNLEELGKKTKNAILRRKKQDVIDMPDKTIKPVYHELTKKQKSEYDRLWEDYLEKRQELGKKGNPNRDLVELILLRQYIAMEAIPYTIDIAENIIDQGEKVVIFTNFSEELQELENHFGKNCVVHHGSMKEDEKQKSVDDFQNKNNIKVFIGNIKSAGVGITLTSSSNIIFNSFDWVPANNEQGEDRCYRIGTKYNVTVYYQLFKDTISSRIWNVLYRKKEVINKIVGENDDERVIEEKIMEEVLNED